MRASRWGTIASCVLAFASVHCGGATEGTRSPSDADSGSPPQGAEGGADSGASSDGDAGPLDDSGLCEGTRTGFSPSVVPAEHRPTAAACAPSGASLPATDGGSTSCASSADCNGDAATYNPLTCLGGTCSYDECLTDADCPTATLCVCGADTGGGFIRHYNVCVPADCRVDSDCGAGAYCSPSRGYCGSLSGYYCHGTHDTCVDPSTDCPCVSPPYSPACVYAPEVGYWVCGVPVCMG
jgi:hypothetical protein